MQREQWLEFEIRGEQLTRRFEGLYRLNGFDYLQPRRLQPAVPVRLRKPYATPVAYTDWGPIDAPLLVCIGGVANTAMRFSFLAADLSAKRRVVCMDWLGRGRSGWLADGSEYGRASYVEQLRQLIEHLRPTGPVDVLGSSMGGSVALALAAQAPRKIGRLLLNDVGPAMPMGRRRRRADTLARHYVFRSPDEMTRRVGASNKNDGPISPEIREFLAFHQTRWSSEDGGRIFRHDPRAMLAYRDEVAQGLDQWREWKTWTARSERPVLLLHGLESDALTPAILARMGRHPGFSLAQIPRTGHTPLLADRHQTQVIEGWLRGDWGSEGGARLSIPLASPRLAWR